MIYACRVECQADAARFILAMCERPYEEHPGGFVVLNLSRCGMTDSLLTFETDCELKWLRSLLLCIADCHVMAETVELYGNYTGNRRSITDDGSVYSELSE